MSRTKETRLLMETWRKFINESAMDSSILLTTEAVEEALNVFSSYSRDLDSSRDELIGKIFWDSAEGDLQLITDLDSEGYELSSVSSKSETMSKWVREEFVRDFHVEDLLELEDLEMIKSQLDSEDILAPGDFDKVYNLSTNEVEVRNSDTGEVLQGSDL